MISHMYSFYSPPVVVCVCHDACRAQSAGGALEGPEDCARHLGTAGTRSARGNRSSQVRTGDQVRRWRGGKATAMGPARPLARTRVWCVLEVTARRFFSIRVRGMCGRSLSTVSASPYCCVDFICHLPPPVVVCVCHSACRAQTVSGALEGPKVPLFGMQLSVLSAGLRMPGVFFLVP
jgi:hypothetical protein